VRTGKLLKPGETHSVPGPPVYVFCSSTAEIAEPWKAVEEEVTNLPKWQVFR
jgi:hypothetical protein